MRLFKWRKILGVCCLLFISLGLMLCWFLVSKKKPDKSLAYLRVILWWNGADGMPSYESRWCGMDQCMFTSNRKYLSEAKAVLFYASSMKFYDMPLPRQPWQLWGLLHEESPRNQPILSYEHLWPYFNFTSTFSRHSDMPLTTQYLLDVRDLTTQKYMVPIGQKRNFRSQLAPVVFIQSDCKSMSGREEYVRELMQHIQVDSYGKCLNNRKLPESLNKDYLNKLYSKEMLRFLSRYKFILSYENGICHDYITEKYWRPLLVGSVPVYFGAPNIRDWEPHNKSSIYINDFASPKELADFLIKLDANDTEYVTYLRHKFNQIEPIPNQRLLHEMFMKDYTRWPEPNIFSNFDCFVCRALANASQASMAHYQCPLFTLPPMERKNVNNSSLNEWKNIFGLAKCQGRLIRDLLEKNEPFSETIYNFKLRQMLTHEKCDNYTNN